jgi:hypothetical protein
MKFRMLSDHYINDRIFSAGEVAEMPSDWKPSGQCEPLDSEAVAAFHAMGPQQLGAIRVGLPKTHWLGTPMGAITKWQLTGLGSAMPAIMN